MLNIIIKTSSIVPTINNVLGRCKELSEEALRNDPTLTLVRGYYYCVVWGRRQHWWTVHANGSIFDSSKGQFPSNGNGVYEPFDGSIECEECGKVVQEDDAYTVGLHAYCSYECYGHAIM